MLLKISLLMAGLVLSIGIIELHILTLQIVEEMHTRTVTSQVRSFDCVLLASASHDQTIIHRALSLAGGNTLVIPSHAL
jgi:hypothetical protein